MAITHTHAYWVVNSKAISNNVSVKLSKKNYFYKKKVCSEGSSKHKFYMSWLLNKLLKTQCKQTHWKVWYKWIQTQYI